MERAGSAVKTWLASCLTCIWPQGDERVLSPHVRDTGVERDMKICHDQPHLVPPMRLVLYDDLPSPGIQPQSRTSTISSWVAEGRNLAAKASDRASLSIRRKTWNQPRRPTISRPSNFRRVSHRSPSPKRIRLFRPLELSIYLPGNRLSALPVFDDFDLDSSWLSPPPQAYSPVEEPYSRYPEPTPFTVPRKPIGSVSYRLSSGSCQMDVLDYRRALPADISPTTQSPKGSNNFHMRSKSEPLSPVSNSGNSSSIDFARRSSVINDKPLPSIPHHAAPQSPLPESPSSFSQSVSQTPGMTPVSTSNSPTEPDEPDPSHFRSRTLSGSTISSNFASMTTAARSQSFSSFMTGTTEWHAPSIQYMLDKDFEAGFGTAVTSKVAVPRPEGHYPTVYEGRHWHFNTPYSEGSRTDGIGLAF